jgi:hypothetical protein
VLQLDRRNEREAHRPLTALTPPFVRRASHCRSERGPEHVRRRHRAEELSLPTESNATDRPLAGACECGAVRYEVADAFLYAANCHCSR